MWILYLSYFDSYGTFYRNKFLFFKSKEKAEMYSKNKLEIFRKDAIEMIKLYNDKHIISEYYDQFDICEIENILSDDIINKEEKIKWLTKTCFCCSHIQKTELDMDSDIVLEHSFPP